MRQVAFGNLGLQLSPIGLGTMPLAIQGRPSPSDAARLLRRALDAGINWLDTADSYCLDDGDVGYGERLIAQTLRDAGSPRVMVTTKGGWIRPQGEWLIEGSPDRLKAACEASLRALGVDSIFLYQLHAPDPQVPFSDSVGALADLQRAGKIRHVGLSNVDLGHIHQAQREVEVRLVQNRCNIFDQWSFENGVIDYCRARQIPFVAHSPIGGHKGHVRALESRSLRAVAQRRGLSEKDVSLLWLLAQDGIFPIPGGTRAESLDANLRALSQTLGAEDLAELGAEHPRRKGLRPLLLQTRNNLRWLGRAVQRRLR
jgi:aryl-alcohol dehydrogenase-like predicted oxidoreductase